MRLQIPPSVSDHSLGEESLAFLQSNILRCVGNCEHALPTSKTFLPSRLIDVRKASLIVVETEALKGSRQTDTIHYATLSYCWGSPDEGSAQLKLTRESSSELLSGFSPDAMSSVQRDAVSVSRALGIPYLWIDALCIIQGDISDWERESSQMHKIYSCSYLCISNLATESCQHSFLSSNRIQASIPYDTLSRSKKSECYGMGPAWLSSYFGLDLEEGSWSRSDFDEARWSKRAWTFQEAAMTTRTVIIASSGIYFNCSKGLVWEYGRVLEKPASISVGNVLEDKPVRDVYKQWYLEVATQFSGRRPTYLSDSFPALSGIAQTFALVLNDEYVAGLWKNDLINGLFWKWDGSLASSFSKLMESFKSPYVGPTWSWVGRVEGEFGMGKVKGFGPGGYQQYPEGSSAALRVHCDVLEVQTSPAGIDKFGRLSSAELLLKARVYPLSLGCCHMPDDPDRMDNPRGPRLIDSGQFCLEPPGGNKIPFSYYLDFFPNPDVNDPDQRWKYELLLVLVGSISYESDEQEDSDSEEMPCGLIVHQAETEGTYWRVGTFGPATTAIPETRYELELDFFEECEMRTLKII
ncbi:hypothetical protein FZEAL_7570 [Fusarium zealandicum]|uniref:Heterokaryon incompatibility domain-containing protein n=1 Tax=Fusarium zealandicum TaxID=1053134 RepID=A0A8H4UFW1_9HYPO|nr:hypothetical protein FZEAL_7570 [Fusarium zealandicum]